jgi:hypothetical protein
MALLQITQPKLPKILAPIVLNYQAKTNGVVCLEVVLHLVNLVVKILPLKIHGLGQVMVTQ